MNFFFSNLHRKGILLYDLKVSVEVMELHAQSTEKDNQQIVSKNLYNTRILLYDIKYYDITFQQRTKFVTTKYNRIAGFKKKRRSSEISNENYMKLNRININQKHWLQRKS